MLNIELLKNPLNWIIVILMLFIAGMFGTFLCSYFSNQQTQDA